MVGLAYKFTSRERVEKKRDELELDTSINLNCDGEGS